MDNDFTLGSELSELKDANTQKLHGNFFFNLFSENVT